MTKILFFLPSAGKNPVGGYKIVYEYANLFSRNGYDTSIVYPFIKTPDLRKLLLLKKIKSYIGFKIKKHSFQNWFTLDKNVKEVLVYNFNDLFIKKYKDYKIIATAYQTSIDLNNAKCIPNNNKFYFIQDFEIWNGITKDDVLNTFKFPIKKIVISTWLKDLVDSVSDTKAVLIPNGLDFEYFKCTNKIENRNPKSVGFLYHLDERKRCRDTIAALEIVKRKFPDLKISMFGVPNKPDNIPFDFDYYQMPNKEIHNYFYNNISIFIAASNAEGMALPPAEAMICGAALCCTDIGGFKMYAIKNKTALTSEVYNIEELANNITNLIENNDLRIELAKNGNAFIQQYTWTKAFNTFKKTIEDLI